MNPRVKEIVDVNPYVIKIKWTNGEVKTVDFNLFLAKERDRVGSVYSRLFSPETFRKVKTDGRTIYWDDLTEMIDEAGHRFPAPLDFCPDVIYQASN